MSQMRGKATITLEIDWSAPEEDPEQTLRNQKMLKTEDEARKLVCPMARAHPTEDLKCIGSQCMAWRWRSRSVGSLVPKRVIAWTEDGDYVTRLPEGEAPKEPERPDQVGPEWEFGEGDNGVYYWVEPQDSERLRIARAESFGFCGMAHGGD